MVSHGRASQLESSNGRPPGPARPSCQSWLCLTPSPAPCYCPVLLQLYVLSFHLFSDALTFELIDDTQKSAYTDVGRHRMKALSAFSMCHHSISYSASMLDTRYPWVSDVVFDAVPSRVSVSESATEQFSGTSRAASAKPAPYISMGMYVCHANTMVNPPRQTAMRGVHIRVSA